MLSKKYDIGKYGFLPNAETIVTKLPLQFEHYQPIIDNLTTNDADYYCTLVNNLYIDEIPLDFTQISLEESKFVYSILSMICHKYVWCRGEHNHMKFIPAKLAKPWRVLQDILGLPPILTHAAVDLYNFSLKDCKKDYELDNLKSNYLLTGTIDEEWFYLVMVAIEAKGGRLIEPIYKLLIHIENGDNYGIRYILIKVYNILTKMNGLMSRMKEKCNPEVFFNILRIYLTGWTNLELFPNGMIYEGVSEKPLRYNGGSAAQSSLIQVFDILFEVDHVKYGSSIFLKNMRDYMPLKHRQFLEDLETKLFLRQYLIQQNDETLIILFNQCIEKLINFRMKHIGMVGDYIIKESKKIDTQHGKEGSGGTDLLNFLHKPVDATRDAKI